MQELFAIIRSVTGSEFFQFQPIVSYEEFVPFPISSVDELIERVTQTSKRFDTYLHVLRGIGTQFEITVVRS